MPRIKLLTEKKTITDIACQLVKNEGMEALTMRRLCKELGVSPMTLYSYISNIDEVKRDILIQGFNRLYAGLLDNLKANRAEHPDNPVLAYSLAYADVLYDFSEEAPRICEYLIGDGWKSFGKDAELRQFYDVFSNLRTGSSDPDAKLKFRMLGSMVNALVYEQNSGVSPISRSDLEKCVETMVARLFTS